MKKIVLLTLVLLFSIQSSAQQELIDNNWTLHYMIIDGVTYDVTQPTGGDPDYHPGIDFFEITNGYQVNGIIHFNYFFDSEGPTIIGTDTFTVNTPSVTLGDCFPYCELEGRYLSTILAGDFIQNRTYGYEIVDGSNNDKTLIITTPEGNTAVHGNYILSTNEVDKEQISIYPNPVENMLNISSKELAVEGLRIFSVLGEDISAVKIHEGNPIDISFLKSGIYFMEITFQDNKKYMHKFIKQ